MANTDIHDRADNMLFWGESPVWWSTPCGLGINVVDPPDGLNIVDRSQVSLSCCQIRMPQDYLADNFNGNPGTGCISGSVPTKVMWPEMDSHQFSRPNHHQPCSLIGNRKNAILRRIACILDIFAKPVRNLLRDKDDFMLVAAFWRLQDKFLVLKVLLSEFQDLSDPHPPAGHQLKNQPVPDLCGSENDLIDNILFDDFPFRCHLVAVKISDHGHIAWINRIRLDVVTDKVEKAGQLRVSDAFCVWSVAQGEAVQEGQGFVRCNLANWPITELPTERVNNGLIGPQGIFFSNGPCGNQSRSLRLWIVSWPTSLTLWG
jgi:hypothetical protein